MPHPLMPSSTDQVVRRLAKFSSQVFSRHGRAAGSRMPQIAWGMANSAIEQRASGLLRDATRLWLAQDLSADEIDEDEARSRTRDLISEASTWTIRTLTATLEDRYEPLAARLV